MNYTRSLLVVAVLFLAVAACKKGDTGPAGANGEDGKDGNANVVAYTFADKTFIGILDLTLNNLSQGKVDSSLVLAYYNPANETTTAWYPIPGAGSGGTYSTRSFLYQSVASPVSTYTFGIRTMKQDGSPYTTSVTFRKIRIFLAPASTITPGGRVATGGTGLPFDAKDYYSVIKYYGLAE